MTWSVPASWTERPWTGASRWRRRAARRRPDLLEGVALAADKLRPQQRDVAARTGDEHVALQLGTGVHDLVLERAVLSITRERTPALSRTPC